MQQPHAGLSENHSSPQTMATVLVSMVGGDVHVIEDSLSALKDKFGGSVHVEEFVDGSGCAVHFGGPEVIFLKRAPVFPNTSVRPKGYSLSHKLPRFMNSPPRERVIRPSPYRSPPPLVRKNPAKRRREQDTEDSASV